MWFLVLAATMAAAGADDAFAGDELMDTLDAYYRDYRRMDDQQLRAELTIVWYTTAGGAYYNLKERVSADCRDTSQAAADLWQQLPTLESTTQLVVDAVAQAAAEIRAVGATAPAAPPPPHPMEILCKRLERSLRTNPSLYAQFGRMKGGNSQRRPAILAAAPTVNTDSFEQLNAFKLFWLGNPRIADLVTHATFADYVASANDTCAWKNRLAKAIVDWSRRPELATSTQRLYDKVRADLIRADVFAAILVAEQRGQTAPVIRVIRDNIMNRLREEFAAQPKFEAQLQKLTTNAGCRTTAQNVVGK